MANTEPVYVSLEFTPNPNTLKYSVNRQLLPKGAVNMTRREDAERRSPLGVKLFAIPGIQAVMIGKDFITVNAVSPGYTLSEGNLANETFLASYREAAIATRALPRDAWPADIVGAVAFLCSDDAAFISGQILAVDGGSVYH